MPASLTPQKLRNVGGRKNDNGEVEIRNWKFQAWRELLLKKTCYVLLRVIQRPILFSRPFSWCSVTAGYPEFKKKKKFLFWSNLLYSDKVFWNHKTPLNAVLYFAGISQMQHMPIQAEYGKHFNMEYSRKQDFHIVCQCINLISNCDLQRFVITICILFFRQCNFWLNSFLGSHSFFVLGLLKCWDS